MLALLAVVLVSAELPPIPEANAWILISSDDAAGTRDFVARSPVLGTGWAAHEYEANDRSGRGHQIYFYEFRCAQGLMGTSHVILPTSDGSTVILPVEVEWTRPEPGTGRAAILSYFCSL